MQAVILAGGLGTRLKELTGSVPKPMVEINGKPFLYYQLQMLKRHGIKEVLLLTGYLGEQIEDYFKDGKELGISITYSKEPEQLGTGGALKYAQTLLKEEFILLNGDTYLDIDYQTLALGDADGVLVVRKTDDQDIANAQVKEGKITAYTKTSETPLAYVDAGVQLFKKDIINLIPEGKVSLEEEIFPKLIKKQTLNAFITEELFYDMGTKERLEKIKDILK